MAQQIKKVTIIGMGQVGQAIAQKLLALGIHVHEWYNRSPIDLSVPIQNRRVDHLNQVSDADLFLLCVSDDAIKEVSEALPQKIKNSSIVAHTSGIKGLNELSHDILHPSIFYPLNSFSIGNDIDWSNTPILLSASSEIRSTLSPFANQFSSQVYTVSKKQKEVLHACAVIVNNFSNALYHMASNRLALEKLSLEPLLPLIQTTASKINHLSPEQAQTGPAMRGDKKTIQKHLDLLEEQPDVKEIYQLFTNYIQTQIRRNENH